MWIQGKIPWRRGWQLIPIFLPGKFHGQRSLVGYSPGGCKELDRTEHTHTHVLNPRECSMCTWTECVFCYFWCNVLKVSTKSNYYIVSFWLPVALLIFCLKDLSIDVSQVLKSPTIIVFPSIYPFMSVSIYVFSCSYIDWIYVDECAIISLYWSFYHNIVSFFISLNNLWLKVYFVWYECCNPCFLVISICLKWFFPSSHFQSVCIICSKMSLL